MKDGRYFQLPYGERHRRLTGLIGVTDQHNIADVVVCGMPFVKKWAEDDFFLRPKYYLDSSSRVKAARDTDLQVAAAFMDYKRRFAGTNLNWTNWPDCIRSSVDSTRPTLELLTLR